jgi:hypothetical protein
MKIDTFISTSVDETYKIASDLINSLENIYINKIDYNNQRFAVVMVIYLYIYSLVNRSCTVYIITAYF